MLDVADLLFHQPLPAGRRVAIVTNVGGPAVMCADACEAHGLELPSLSEATRATLRELLPAEASVANPVDMLAAATAEQCAVGPRHRRGSQRGCGDLDFPAAPGRVHLCAASARVDTPGGARIPGYHTPEPAAIALSHAVRYADWRARPVEDPPTLSEIQKDEAGLLLAEALLRGDGWLTSDEVQRLLEMYGVSVVNQRLVATVAETANAATALGGEVVLKAVAPGLLQKSDVGGVRLHLVGPQAVTAAASDMAAAVGRAMGK